MDPQTEFADYVDHAGRFIRHWTYGSGHRPLMEVSTDREAFDPPFESGPVLIDVLHPNGITIKAPNEAHWRWTVAEFALAMLVFDFVQM